MPVNPASRLANIAPFHVMELLARARQLEQQGRDIIHMEVGEPDFPTPQPIVDAAQEHIASGRVFYTPALGLPELRGAIADFYAARYGVNVTGSEVIGLTPMQALIDAADFYLRIENFKREQVLEARLLEE